jgi:hypothetical protein
MILDDFTYGKLLHFSPNDVQKNIKHNLLNVVYLNVNILLRIEL